MTAGASGVGQGASPARGRLSAEQIADKLREASDLLEAQDADRFRAD